MEAKPLLAMWGVGYLMKTDVIPHEPMCLAKTRQGTRCKRKGMRNGRCNLHGGKSTGPRTPEGKAKIAAAQYKHGRRSKIAIAERKAFKKYLTFLNKQLNEIT